MPNSKGPRLKREQASIGRDEPGKGIREADEYAQRRGYRDYRAYKLQVLLKEGFASSLVYMDALSKRPGREKYRLLAEHISLVLETHAKSVGWLAKHTRIPVEHVSLYRRGIVFPRSRRLKVILSVLAKLSAGAR